MAACSRFIEISVISPYPYYGDKEKDADVLLDPEARPTTLELIVACKALEDFNTLQIVRLPMGPPLSDCWCNGPCECGNPSLPVESWERILEKHVKGLGGWAIECLEKVKVGCLEGEGGKRTTVRTVEFSYDHPVKVTGYEV